MVFSQDTERDTLITVATDALYKAMTMAVHILFRKRYVSSVYYEYAQTAFNFHVVAQPAIALSVTCYNS